MSDVPLTYSIFKWKLSLEEPSLAYAAKANARPVLFVVGIPYPLFKLWQEYMVKQHEMHKAAEVDKPGEKEDHCPNQGNLDYVDLFELSMPGSSFAITTDKTIRSEVNASLRKLAGMVKPAYNKAKGGHKRKELDSCIKRFHLFEGMTISVKELQKENEKICDELEKWKKSYKNLHEEKEKLYLEMVSAVEEKNEEINILNKGNKELLDYVDRLEQKNNFKNQGKDVANVAKKSRTLNNFMSRAKLALWFMKSFGLELTELKAREQLTGIVHCLSVDDNHTPADGTTGFESLSSHDQAKVEEVLFLLDKFCVGDSFYHELTMIIDGLPKSYQIKQRRGQLNNISNVVPTPGKADGAQISFTDMLNEFIKLHNEADWSKEFVQVKISGDGAQMTRNSSFILLSFSLLQNQDDVRDRSLFIPQGGTEEKLGG